MKPSPTTTMLSAASWTERIRTFTPAWFICSMGTSILSQVLYNFPYPAGWLHRLAYCLWVLLVVLFAAFTLLALLHLCLFPRAVRAALLQPDYTSRLGAVPISLDGIATGTVLFYSDRAAGPWAAYGLWWVAVGMSVAVACLFLNALARTRETRALSDITAVCLLSFIPQIVTSATGSLLVPVLDTSNAAIVLFISFLLWSTGELFCFLLLATYTQRLMTHPLPDRANLLSVFVPMGPTGLGAFSIQNMAGSLSTCLRTANTATLEPSSTPRYPIVLAMFVSLPLLVLATAFLVHALASLFARRLRVVPKHLNPAIWSVVFPLCTYSLGLGRVAKALQQVASGSGREFEMGLGPLGTGGARVFRGWSAAVAVLLAAIWLGCAIWSCWRGVWLAELVGVSANTPKDKNPSLEAGEAATQTRMHKAHVAGEGSDVDAGPLTYSSSSQESSAPRLRLS